MKYIKFNSIIINIPKKQFIENIDNDIILINTLDENNSINYYDGLPSIQFITNDNNEINIDDNGEVYNIISVDEKDNESIDNESIDNESIDNKEVDNKEVDNKSIDNKEVDNESHLINHGNYLSSLKEIINKPIKIKSVKNKINKNKIKKKINKLINKIESKITKNTNIDTKEGKKIIKKLDKIIESKKNIKDNIPAIPKIKPIKKKINKLIDNIKSEITKNTNIDTSEGDNLIKELDKITKLKKKEEIINDQQVSPIKKPRKKRVAKPKIIDPNEPPKEKKPRKKRVAKPKIINPNEPPKEKKPRKTRVAKPKISLETPVPENNEDGHINIKKIKASSSDMEFLNDMKPEKGEKLSVDNKKILIDDISNIINSDELKKIIYQHVHIVFYKEKFFSDFIVSINRAIAKKNGWLIHLRLLEKLFPNDNQKIVLFDLKNNDIIIISYIVD